MSVGVLGQGQDMGRKAKGRGIQVRLDAELVRKAKFVAAARGKTLQDYLHDKLERVVDTEFRRSIGLPPGAGQGPQEPGQGGAE